MTGRMVVPEHAACQLGGALLLGLALGLLYDLYRVWFRRAGRMRALGDIGWWLLALAVALPVLYRIDGLALRGFTLALVALAAAGEQLLISPHFYPLGQRACARLLRLIGWLARLIARVVELVLLPLVWLADSLLRMLSLLAWLLWWPIGKIAARAKHKDEETAAN